MRLFHSLQPELVFMDIVMPGASGDGAALHMLQVQPLIRVVVITGVDRTDSRVRTLVSAGAYEVIEKPIRFERLRDVLHLIKAETGALHRIR